MDDTIVTIIIIYKKSPILNVNPISGLYTTNKKNYIKFSTINQNLMPQFFQPIAKPYKPQTFNVKPY
jgi:hypothetical protein